MNPLASCVHAFDRVLTRILKVVTVTLFMFLLLLLTFNIVVRYLPVNPSLEWMDEITELCVASMVFYGAAAVWMVKGHFSAGNWITKVCRNPRLISLYRAGVELVSLLFMAILFRYSLKLTLHSEEVTAVFQIPKAVQYSCMPIASGIMCLYSIGALVVEVMGVLKPNLAE